MASSEQAELNRQARAANEAWQRAVIAFERTGALLESSRALIDASRSLLATMEARKTDTPMENSRALIDEGRQLLAAVQNVGLPPTPFVNPAVHHGHPASIEHSAAFSIRVFKEGARFGWSLKGPLGEMLGEGTAATELKARSDAFCAGMTYIERQNRRSAATDRSLH